MTAGASRVVITPPIGFPMAGYGNRERGCERVDDDLHATALVLDDGTTKVAIITTDWVGVPAALTQRVRQLVEERTGIPGRHVLVCASHTHFGPTLDHVAYLPGALQEDFDRSYVENAIHLLAGAVQAADQGRRPAAVGHGLGDAGNLVFNRRTRKADGKVVMSWRMPPPEQAQTLHFGPKDPDVSVLRVDGTDGTPIAALISLACHPVCGVDRLYAVSGDYPYYAKKTVERVRGGLCLFALGCAGNIVPIVREGRAREWIGTALGAEAVQAMEGVRTTPEADLAVRSVPIEIPLRRLPTVAEARNEVRKAQRRLARWEKASTRPEEVDTPKGDLMRARHFLRLAKEAAGRTTIPTEIQAVRVGEVTLIGLPGEVFVEIGISIKQGSPRTFVFSLCNDELDYVPIPAAFEEGGYEPEWTRVGVDAAETLIRAAKPLTRP